MIADSVREGAFCNPNFLFNFLELIAESVVDVRPQHDRNNASILVSCQKHTKFGMGKNKTFSSTIRKRHHLATDTNTQNNILIFPLGFLCVEIWVFLG